MERNKAGDGARDLRGYFLNLFILIGGKLLYNIVVVFAIYRHESAMDVHVSRHPKNVVFLLIHYALA